MSKIGLFCFSQQCSSFNLLQWENFLDKLKQCDRQYLGLLKFVFVVLCILCFALPFIFREQMYIYVNFIITVASKGELRNSLMQYYAYPSSWIRRQCIRAYSRRWSSQVCWCSLRLGCSLRYSQHTHPHLCHNVRYTYYHSSLINHSEFGLL